MISVVVMAGYQNKREVKRYSKIVAENYGEAFIESGYKPLREFTIYDKGQTVSKPLIQFTLEKLFDIDEVEDIVIVGHQMLLEQKLGDVLQHAGKPCVIINQNKPLSEDIMMKYNIVPGKVKHNSITGNMIKGYDACMASSKTKHALFAAADSPLTTREFIERFIEKSSAYLASSAIVVPVTIMKDKTDKLNRHPLRLINDTPNPLSGYTDAQGRHGFRLSSLLLANPNLFDLNAVDMAYNLRKLLNPKIQIRLFKITRNLGFSNVYSKYFMKKDLSITDCEKITSMFFNGHLSILPMDGEEASYDYDGTEKEYRLINEMLEGPA
ncbi:MAG: hypothetical protein FP816_04480 [Desulfobacteraceae bacterium]|nr:hypothetical protein [Desulfobacteraceae bacterium]MBU4002575.1 hypothetical protein [Pseudomonadota bacterium]